MIQFGNTWDKLLENEFKKDYYLKLREFLKEEYGHYRIYPNMHDIFNALKLTAPEKIKAVILGQDPYHRPGQAHGLCFSVQKGVDTPPSLQNMYKELHADIGMPFPSHGYLKAWAEEGVLMLNTTLTVREGSPMSHKGKGWETLTDKIIEIVNAKESPVVFLLWGGHARSKKQMIDQSKHLVLEAAHPSPLSAYNGFFGCKHFSKANAFLEEKRISPINWASILNS